MNRLGTMGPLLLAGLLLPAGCGSSGGSPPAQSAVPPQQSAAAAFPMTVETCGRQVTLQRRPERVMTVGAEAPGLVWAAGAANQIDVMATPNGSLGPAAAALEDVPVITPDKGPSKEVILGQKPDLILSYGVGTPWEEIEAFGIPQIVISGQCDETVNDGPKLDGPASFQQIYHDIELYGRIFGTEDTAAKAVADYRARVAAVKQRFDNAPKRTAAVVAAFPGLLAVYGPVSISNVALQTLGLTNAFADITGARYAELNIEALLDRNPDVLIVTSGHGESPDVGVQRLRSTPGFDKLTAVREGHFIPVDNEAIIGGIMPIEELQGMADTLAGF